ncbi:MAG: hypothetical protein B6D39_05780 [Anaerolineae bacterium UTCFX2]|nr:glycosyltransferase family 2 protein [Anaerolineales bacterium]OQY91877.1 MAG: hypothetical protein B6D39_05780 [Anaerolineae bacterium UTCFX2]
MTRIGINPARGGSAARLPARVTVAILTYLPSLDGYFAQRLEVLKLALASLKAHTSLPHDLFIFDNGSCATVVEYLNNLKTAGQMDYLLLSQRNIGKIDALRVLFNAAPGELIAYSDDDILFYPGWLEAHLEALDAFPRAGMVSGAPLRGGASHAMRSLEALASAGVPGLELRRERLIPDDWERDWALSTGRDPQAHLAETRDQLDLALRLKKPDGSGFVETIGGANHFQYLTPKQTILKALPSDWTGRLMGWMIELDEAVDRLGYLRLSTAQRFTRHLGNRLPPEIVQEAERLGLLDLNAALLAPGAVERQRKKSWLLRLPGSRRLFHATYKRLFDLLYN